MAAPSAIVDIGGILICAGVDPMYLPEGGAHVRAIDIRIPAGFAGRPTVIATPHAVTGPAGSGIVFGVYSIKVNQLGPAETQVAVEAANVSREGAAIDGDFFCNYVVVGKRGDG